MNTPNPNITPAKTGEVPQPMPPPADAAKAPFTPAKDEVKAPLQAAKGNDEVMSQPQQKQS